ncbi:hypothetical protein EDI_118760 [Entamoeba dispar SAW760]|uniref:Uncharacterized protein n=1 Tax=Entamoeba dispar (strain ATCC PRA-260 / SAW760) TaxID=370354 RepID=B0E9V4_ENTDS|nr:uncharacterized protein EDI_118760 [Entamoeba dispar SAW760]EDR28699.1 hypothetical protein EDI_118760 [Entamoeba dispar SAW760]|eukprot:EDR28699.1 hypothetical protein EDI_118760 [Entamoeba dispar SAW760]
MFGSNTSNIPDVFNSSEETEIEETNASIKDLNMLLTDIIELADKANMLSTGVSMSFGDKPMYTLNKTINTHLDIIQELKRDIKNLQRKNRLIITKLRSEDKKDKELEKSVKEETKPKRRKTQLL